MRPGGVDQSVTRSDMTLRGRAGLAMLAAGAALALWLVLARTTQHGVSRHATRHWVTARSTSRSRARRSSATRTATPRIAYDGWRGRSLRTSASSPKHDRPARREDAACSARSARPVEPGRPLRRRDRPVRARGRLPQAGDALLRRGLPRLRRLRLSGPHAAGGELRAAQVPPALTQRAWNQVRDFNVATDITDPDGVISAQDTESEPPATARSCCSTTGAAKCHMLEALGRALHTAQDFYSNSNWGGRQGDAGELRLQRRRRGLRRHANRASGENPPGLEPDEPLSVPEPRGFAAGGR